MRRGCVRSRHEGVWDVLRVPRHPVGDRRSLRMRGVALSALTVGILGGGIGFFVCAVLSRWMGQRAQQASRRPPLWWLRPENIVGFEPMRNYCSSMRVVDGKRCPAAADPHCGAVNCMTHCTMHCKGACRLTERLQPQHLKDVL